MSTESPEKCKPKPLNVYMKVGLACGLSFMIISQLLMLLVIPFDPPHLGLIINIGTVFNILVFPSVLVLIYGVIKRRLSKPVEATES